MADIPTYDADMDTTTRTAPTLRPTRIQGAGWAALRYIATHPGCSILAVDRAARTARGGHRWMYATVTRLIRRGLVLAVPATGRAGYALTIAPGVSLD